MLPTFVSPRHTVQSPRSQEQRPSPLLGSPSPPSYLTSPPSRSPSPVRELSPTFSIYDGREGDGTFPGGEPECVTSARMRIESEERDRWRRKLITSCLRDQEGDDDLSTGPSTSLITAENDPTGLYELLSQPYVEPPPLPPLPPPLRPQSNLEGDPAETGLLDQGDENAIAYTPFGKYLWATGKGAGLMRPLTLLGDFSHPHYGSWTTVLMDTTIGGRPIRVMCKSWPLNEPKSRFLTEFKLLSSASYLRSLQGIVVSWLIGLYNTPDSIMLFMEPPHHYFWVNPSPSMSDVLKQRVVRAYTKLHRVGVLHGAVERNNILINGNGRVTLVDFSMARATRPIPEIGLAKCTKKELEMEMQKVKFILKYETADHEMRSHSLDPRVWQHWINACEKPARRWLVPGGIQEDYAKEVSAFREIVCCLGKRRPHGGAPPLLVLSADSPLPVRQTHAQCSPPLPIKRKASGFETQDGLPPTKRPRVRSTELNSPHTYVQKWECNTQSYCCSTELPAASSESSTPTPPPVKVRDFALEPYTGPRGYYVPHPPTEMTVSSYRSACIRNDNAVKCNQLGLPYWRGKDSERGLDPPSYRRPMPKGRSISLGKLKRRAIDLDDYEEEDMPIAKKMRYDSLKKTRIQFNENIIECMPWEYERIPGEPEGARLTSPLSYPRHHSKHKPRGVLRATASRKTFCYDLGAWPVHEDEAPLSSPILQQCRLLPLQGEAESEAGPPTGILQGVGGLETRPSTNTPQAESQAGPSAESEAEPLTDLWMSTPSIRQIPTVDEDEAQPYHLALLGSARRDIAEAIHYIPMDAEAREAWEVVGLLADWDPSLEPQECLFALFEAVQEDPYQMDTDIDRWLRNAMKLYRP